MDTALTPEIIAKICSMIRCGVDYDTAAVAIGSDKNDADEWKKDQAMQKAVLEATAQCEVLMLQKIVAEGGATGAKWILENKFPGIYKQQKMKNLESNQQVPLIINQSKNTKKTSKKQDHEDIDNFLGNVDFDQFDKILDNSII